MNYTAEYVAEVISKKAAEAGNQKILAAQVGLDQTTLSKWKNGKQLPTPETFFKYFPLEEEPVTTSRPKKPAVETIFIAGDANDQIMTAMCLEIREAISQVFKKCYVRTGSMDWHNLLVISIEKKRVYYTDPNKHEYFFRKIYPDPIDHAYLDPEWSKLVVKDFVKSAEKWLLAQFKG